MSTTTTTPQTDYILTQRIDKKIFEDNMNILLSQLQKHNPAITMDISYILGINTHWNNCKFNYHRATFTTSNNGTIFTIKTSSMCVVRSKEYFKAYTIESHHCYFQLNTLQGIRAERFGEIVPKILFYDFHQKVNN